MLVFYRRTLVAHFRLLSILQKSTTQCQISQNMWGKLCSEKIPEGRVLGLDQKLQRLSWTSDDHMNIQKHIDHVISDY